MTTKAVSTANYGNAVEPFTKAGIHPRWLLPIAPVGAPLAKNATISDKVLGKAPGRFNEDRALWSGLSGTAIVRGVSKSDFAEMQDWPTGSVGLIGRAYPGIDSDANSERARKLVDRALTEAFPNGVYAERLRGAGPRRLYAFKCRDPESETSWVRTRHLTYKLKNEDIEHKLDIIGYGGQYLIAGKHQSGDFYKWNNEFNLTNAENIEEIDNEDMGRFLEHFRRLVGEVGGEIIRASGGRNGTSSEFDLRKLEPAMDVNDILDGIKSIPNTPDNFLHRDDFVSMLAAIRSALGKESFFGDIESEVREWATADQSWCDDEYFDKVWASLERTRVDPDALDRVFRRNGIKSHVRNVFPMSRPKHDEQEIEKIKKQAKDEKGDIIEIVASRYIFGDVNTRDRQSALRMRDRWNAAEEWAGIDWWKFESTRSDPVLLNRIHEMDGFGEGKVGFHNFCRAVQNKHPEVWYSGETKNPNFDRGEIVEETLPDNSTRRELNMRFLSATIRNARKPDPNPTRSQEDVAHVLEFVKLAFGKMAKYELDTLAYMAQTGDRPGSMLFFVGDTGVGKSIYLSMLAAMFDGLGPDQSGIVDGAKLMNENARRFILAKVEGCRILTIKELPKGASARTMAEITSTFKQIVDAGPEGDFLQVEEKGMPARTVRNYFRVTISSNYSDAIDVEEQDRRIFYVRCQITKENRPEDWFYERFLDISRDPERLAAFFRYLLTRDIGLYSRYTDPPMSSEKAERIVLAIDNPIERHSRAAVELLRASNRQVFDLTELYELMSEMSENEYANTNGEFDDRRIYQAERDPIKVMAIRKNMSALLKYCTKLKDVRTSKKRYATAYAFSQFKDVIYKLDHAPWQDVVEFVNDEYEKGVEDVHPWDVYQRRIIDNYR